MILRLTNRLKTTLAAVVVAVFVLAVAVFGVAFPAHLLGHAGFSSVWVTDADGGLLREAAGPMQARARWVPLRGISPWMVKATIASEDSRFVWHPGVDPVAIVRAVTQDVWAMRVVSGASTLTQQTVRLLMPRRPGEGVLRQKLREAVWALRLERACSKDEILEQYLNRAPYGHNIVGVEAAAMLYLGKHAADLTLADAAWLAAVPRGPRMRPRRRCDGHGRGSELRQKARVTM